ncbi:MAG: hypothetical protein ACYTGC_16690 [Planctomycetota bacterium]|jgi:hypothetical protein
MAKKKPYGRPAWQDRFNTPAARDLRLQIPTAERAAFDRIRRSLNDLEGVRETCAWYGDGWNWTLEYRTKHSDEPLAVLVPAPSDIQLAVPMDREFCETLPLKRMKRAVRDGLVLATEPFDTRWAIWSVQAPNVLEDLQELVEAKHRFEAKLVG